MPAIRKILFRIGNRNCCGRRRRFALPVAGLAELFVATAEGGSGPRPMERSQRWLKAVPAASPQTIGQW